jgi:arylsulfatase A-like enzyme
MKSSWIILLTGITADTLNAWANAPVCAVARSAIFAGMHSTTIGTHQMRSRTQLPLIVYLPERWRHLSDVEPGGIDNRMVSFVDLAPTVLSVAGLDVPEIMQGEVFLGHEADSKPELTYFYRDRMSERYDFSRAVTDGRYYFIRHRFINNRQHDNQYHSMGNSGSGKDRTKVCNRSATC